MRRGSWDCLLLLMLPPKHLYAPPLILLTLSNATVFALVA